ncbi:transmembrane protein, putative (macronuclear) [Tetrahymena thermophila SB210]|uniref:Transmembrane protein, putative n=1 Tax=Tetrahymena thermophila (strain SB210) TaxID=312017 RepID=Q22AN9_TETTS|nr:transmembrane protein, putative [Tetrahymena thermophila SB210]EAR82355.2 transmembrane protein, putative [Tetrahymena thermophila SB210]|eukprot:XP_001030018.2 transmembrane protein, putative [Tetrahymena thermophila SB210]
MNAQSKSFINIQKQINLSLQLISKFIYILYINIFTFQNIFIFYQMDGYQKCLTKQSSKNISEALNNSYIQDGLFIENLKQNKEIGPWEQENNNLFDLFCSELEGSHQFIKYSIHTKQRKKSKKKKTVIKNEESVKKYDLSQNKQNVALQQYYYTPQVFHSLNQPIDCTVYICDQDIKIDDQQKAQGYNLERQDELYNFQSNTDIKNYQPTKTLSMVDFPQHKQCFIQQNNKLDENSIPNNNNQNSSFDEKIVLRNFKRKSKSQIRQYENSNKEIVQGVNGGMISQSSNSNYPNNNSLFLEADQTSKQQIIDSFELGQQISQAKLLEKKILQKYFDVNVIQQQHQQQTLSPKNQFFLRGSLQNAQIKDSPSSKAYIGKTERSPIKNAQMIVHQQSEQTQIQQAMLNQQAKFKKFKSLRCKQRSISSQSSQIKIPTLMNDISNERSPIQIEKQKYQTQEDILTSQNIQLKQKNLPILKGNVFAGNNIELSQQQQKDSSKKAANQQALLLKNQRQHHQSANKDQQQIIQQQQLFLEQEEQIYLPQSARNYPDYDQVNSTVSKLEDHKSRKSSFRQSRKDSRDSLNLIGLIKNGNQKNEFDSTRQTPQKNSNYPKISQADNTQNNNEAKQSYNSPWQRKNTNKLPQLILSSILNDNQNNDEKSQVMNSNYADQNINSQRIINFPIYDQKPANRQNSHFSNLQQTKFIQLYFNKSAKKPPIHYQSSFQKHIN